MTALLAALARVDLSDVAILAGLLLLALGLALVSAALACIVIGVLLLAYGALPILVTILGGRR